MQEITSNIFIETSYPGVTLGVIVCSHGQIVIDAPFRAEDIRAWRTSLASLGSMERLLVNLDAHFDRTLGVRAMECTIMAHQKVAEIFHARPVTFKMQSPETGAEWERFEGLGSIRWAPPEITFSDQINLYWEPSPVIFEYHPGSSSGAIWVHVPNEKVIFIGDMVVPGQPPFIGSSDLGRWISDLKSLLSVDYREYLVISGRGGIVSQADIQNQLVFLEMLSATVESIAGGGESEVDRVVPELLKEFKYSVEVKDQFKRRLTWGLNQYLIRHFSKGSAEIIEE
jgi:glyoxylase-like metal-dependent hydrolase (beta-lactamase superfamily II)